MHYRQLGRSGLRVSALTLGTMTFGGAGAFAKVGDTDVEGAGRLIERCRDAGVNMLDTANVYSAGLSEEIIGQVMHGRWGDMLVATKARMKTGAGPNGGGSSRQHLIGECEKSLRRLRRDHIDLFYLHEWDGETPLEETMATLDDLVRAGKIRYIGASNFSAWHLMKAQWAADRLRTTPFVSQQIHYSLQAREAEYELVPVALDQGLGILVWSPLTGGLLTGKYRRDVRGPEGTRHLNEWNEPPIHDEGKLWDIVDVLVEIGEGRGVPPAQIALAWLLGRPAVTSLIIGARNEDQLAVNLGCLAIELAPEERNRLDRVSAPTLIYPYWHQAWTANDRLSPADLSLLAPHVAARSGGASPEKE